MRRACIKLNTNTDEQNAGLASLSPSGLIRPLKINFVRMKSTLHHFFPRTWLIILVMGTGMIWYSCEDPDQDRSFFDKNILTITEYLETNKDQYSSFLKVVEAADLKDALTAYNPFGDGFTLFLPTNEAFDRFFETRQIFNNMEELLDDVNYTRELGRYHLINKSLNTNEFPYGALPDTTASGDFLTIGFSSSLDSTYYKVNNLASVQISNIKVVNGTIHVISDVLEPIAFNSYEWLNKDGGFSILADLFELTGLVDTMGIFRTTLSGQQIKNKYTILAEHDSIFHRNGIQSVEDLVSRYGTPGLDPGDQENGLYQFAAYHILEGSYFLDEFTGSTNYNTYANFPVNINAGLDLKINQGVDTFRYEIINKDTIAINYISLFYQESNQLTKNGAIHMVSEVLELFRPGRTTRNFQFFEEPQIAAVRSIYNVHEFVDVEKFEVISWTGPENIAYAKVAGERASNEDYLLIKGIFTINYTIPKIIPGRYRITMNAHSLSQNNATVRVFIDGKKIGSNIDLSTGGTTANPYKVYTLGSLEFSSFSEHLVRVESLIPGQFMWDYIAFIPE